MILESIHINFLLLFFNEFSASLFKEASIKKSIRNSCNDVSKILNKDEIKYLENKKEEIIKREQKFIKELKKIRNLHRKSIKRFPDNKIVSSLSNPEFIRRWEVVKPYYEVKYKYKRNSEKYFLDLCLKEIDFYYEENLRILPYKARKIYAELVCEKFPDYKSILDLKYFLQDPIKSTENCADYKYHTISFHKNLNKTDQVEEQPELSNKNECVCEQKSRLLSNSNSSNLTFDVSQTISEHTLKDELQTQQYLQHIPAFYQSEESKSQNELQFVNYLETPVELKYRDELSSPNMYDTQYEEYIPYKNENQQPHQRILTYQSDFDSFQPENSIYQQPNQRIPTYQPDFVSYQNEYQKPHQRIKTYQPDFVSYQNEYQQPHQRIKTYKLGFVSYLNENPLYQDESQASTDDLQLYTDNIKYKDKLQSTVQLKPKIYSDDSGTSNEFEILEEVQGRKYINPLDYCISNNYSKFTSDLDQNVCANSVHTSQLSCYLEHQTIKSSKFDTIKSSSKNEDKSSETDATNPTFEDLHYENDVLTEKKLEKQQQDEEKNKKVMYSYCISGEESNDILSERVYDGSCDLECLENLNSDSYTSSDLRESKI